MIVDIVNESEQEENDVELVENDSDNDVKKLLKKFKRNKVLKN